MLESYERFEVPRGGVRPDDRASAGIDLEHDRAGTAACGHSIAEESPELLLAEALEFFSRS